MPTAMFESRDRTRSIIAVSLICGVHSNQTYRPSRYKKGYMASFTCTFIAFWVSSCSSKERIYEGQFGCTSLHTGEIRIDDIHTSACFNTKP